VNNLYQICITYSTAFHSFGVDKQ